MRNLSMFGTGEFGAVFVGHVLECISDDLEPAISEMFRVADRQFVAHIPPRTLSARWHPETSHVIWTAPPTTPFVLWERVGEGRRFVTVPRRAAGRTAYDVSWRSA